MMMQKQQDKLQADEAALISEWRTSKPNAQTNLWYYETDAIAKHHRTLVMSMPHPNRSAKSWALELEKVLRTTERL